MVPRKGDGRECCGVWQTSGSGEKAAWWQRRRAAGAAAAGAWRRRRQRGGGVVGLPRLGEGRRMLVVALGVGYGVDGVRVDGVLVSIGCVAG